MSRWLNRFQPWGVLLLRVVLGIAMVYHGYAKVVPTGGFRHGDAMAAMHHFSQTVVKLGMPYWLGYVSALTEFVGGMFLIVGLLTRFFAFLVTINLVVAIGAVDIHKGYAGAEYALALAVMAVMLLFAGPGKTALDRRIGLM